MDAFDRTDPVVDSVWRAGDRTVESSPGEAPAAPKAAARAPVEAPPLSDALAADLYGHYAEPAGSKDAERPHRLDGGGVTPAIERLKHGIGQAEAAKAEAAGEKPKVDDPRQVEEEARKDPTFKKDPDGARRRAAEIVDARRDLDGLFEAVDPKAPAKDRKQNQLTDQEMRAVLQRYADIKAGRGDLQVEAPEESSPEEAAAFRQKALKDIGRILQTESGRGLVSKLADNKDEKGVHHTTRIHSGAGRFDVGGTRPDKNGSTIEYEPGRLRDLPGAKDQESWAHLLRSDVLLYHEMVHAYHISKGDIAPDAESQTTGLGDWAPGGRYEKKGFKTVKGKPFGDAPFSENRYRADRNHLTQGGRYNDAPLTDDEKRRFPDWESWWQDGKMAQRPKYQPEMDKK